MILLIHIESLFPSEKNKGTTSPQFIFIITIIEVTLFLYYVLFLYWILSIIVNLPSGSLQPCA